MTPVGERSVRARGAPCAPHAPARVHSLAHSCSDVHEAAAVCRPHAEGGDAPGTTLALPGAPRGLEDISRGGLAFSGGHWGATASCGVRAGPGR